MKTQNKKDVALVTIAASSYSGLSEYQIGQIKENSDEETFNFIVNVANIVSFSRLGLDPKLAILQGDPAIAEKVEDLYKNIYKKGALEVSPFEAAEVIYEFLKEVSESKKKKGESKEKGEMKEQAQKLKSALEGQSLGASEKQQIEEFDAERGGKETMQSIDDILLLSEDDKEKLRNAHKKYIPFKTQWDGTYTTEVSMDLAGLLKESTKLKEDVIETFPGAISFKQVLGHLGIADTTAAEKARLNDEVFDIFKKLKMLNTQSKITSKHKSSKRQRVKMRNYGQISKLANKRDLTRVDFDLRFAKKRLNVVEPEPVHNTTLVLIIDDSSSMSNGAFKKKWVKSIIIHRCIEAKKLNARLFLGCFQGTVSCLQEAKSVEEGMDYFNNVYSARGGITDVERSLVDTQKTIKPLLKPSEKMEVMIINDGQDSVHPEMWNFNFPVHAIMLGLENENLKKGVDKTKGLYAFIDKDKAKFYE